MSESGGSQPHDDSDEDIYKDFSDFNFGDELAKLEHSKETIRKEALDLSEQVKVLTKDNEELRKSNEILKKNMSSLLKTAQAEVQRKDLMIEELRNKVDSFTFRRKNKSTKDAFTSTQDLETMKMKNGCEVNRNVTDLKRSKSKECRSSSDSERKFYQEELKVKEFEGDRESINCDNNRKYGYYRDCTRRKSRHSGCNHEEYNKRESHFRKSTKKSESDYRSPFRENPRDYSKYNSYAGRKRSRSCDRRFTYRRRSSRECSGEKRRREKKDASSPCYRRRHSGRSRERSRGSKESSAERPKSRSSPDKDSGSMINEMSNKLNSVNEEGKKGRVERSKKNEGKGKGNSKEGSAGKSEKAGETEKFSTKSPLDALYSEMMTCRSSSRFSKQGSGTTKPEVSEENQSAKTDQHEVSLEEDWTLSFKNERRETVKPMTLYSKRMLQKLSETKDVEKPNMEEKPIVAKSKPEKEPGELTDDENVVESSKEFQELTKVASIESTPSEKPETTGLFKEPKEPVKNKPDDPVVCNEPQHEIRDVIEFSPFKNNYKLIEISPIKPPDKEDLMELYQKRTSTAQAQKEVESSVFNLLSSLSGIPITSAAKEKESTVEADVVRKKSEEKVESKPRTRRNSKCKKSEKKEKSVEEEKCDKSDEMTTPGETTQFLDFFLLTTSPSKPIVPGQPETPGKTETVINSSDPISANFSGEETKNTETEEIKNPQKKEEKSRGGKKGKNSKKEVETKPEKTLKRKRQSESEGDAKKPKLEKSPKKLAETADPVPETKAKEDITTFEFFKPIAKKDAPSECKMTTMSVANIVCLETPNKGVTNLKNLMLNEQMILNVLDSKSPGLCSPLMTPRRMLRNDLMLTDSEDESDNKGNSQEEEKEEEEEEEVEMSDSENSECDSDSGASDFVDLL